MLRAKVTTRDRIEDALDRRVRVTAGLMGTHNRARRVVAKEALDAFREGSHPIEAAAAMADGYTGALSGAAQAEARLIDGIVSAIVAAASGRRSHVAA